MQPVTRYIAEPTRRTPRIMLEPGRIFIVGRSIPVNPGEFYRPVYDWISRYVRVNGNKTRIELGFEYINTSSTKWIYNIIKEIAGMANLTDNARILWYYDQGDDDMCELGFILKSLVECPFFVIETETMERRPEDSVL
jgi:SiaC family regulatory phosphoprotein